MRKLSNKITGKIKKGQQHFCSRESFRSSRVELFRWQISNGLKSPFESRLLYLAAHAFHRPGKASKCTFGVIVVLPVSPNLPRCCCTHFIQAGSSAAISHWCLGPSCEAGNRGLTDAGQGDVSRLGDTLHSTFLQDFPSFYQLSS